MIGKRQLVALVLVLLVATPVVTSMAPASGATSNTLVLSGQAKGTVTINKSETCSSGNIDTSDGQTTVRIYLTDRTVAPKKDLWYILIEAKSKKVTFPSSSATFTLGVNSGASIAYQWATSSKLGSGTLTFGAGYKSGTVSATLAPAPGQKGATHVEKIVGSWAC